MGSACLVGLKKTLTIKGVYVNLIFVRENLCHRQPVCTQVQIMKQCFASRGVRPVNKFDLLPLRLRKGFSFNSK